MQKLPHLRWTALNLAGVMLIVGLMTGQWLFQKSIQRREIVFEATTINKKE